MDKKRGSPLFLMALTILIDFTGFGIIIPLLPFWAQRMGANPTGIGLAVTLYSLAQFLFTPLLGALSDRYGRKPIILIALLIEAFSLALTALAGTFPLLLLARFIGGLGASNIGSAQAVVSDVTDMKDRAKGMGLIGAAIGLGFVIGPALGGVLTPLGATVPFWVAAAVALVNALLVLVLLPETHLKRKAATPTKSGTKGIHVIFTGWHHAAHNNALLGLIAVNCIYSIAFTAMETIFPLFSQHVFHWGATQNAYIFVYIGILVILMQGGLIRQLVKRWNEQTIMLAGLLLLAVGLISLAFSGQLAFLFVSLGLVSIGDGAVSPTISTLLSFISPTEAQGETLGLAQSFASLGRIIGPIAAGELTTFSNPELPLISGGILVVLAVVIIILLLPTIRGPELKPRVEVDTSIQKESAGRHT
jgi:multidrug resistance protein